MNTIWLDDDLELLESISADDRARELFLRLARMSDADVAPLLDELVADAGVDPDTADAVMELVTDRSFLRAVERYVNATTVWH